MSTYGYTGYPIQDYWQLVPPDMEETRERDPWDAPEIIALAKKYNDDPQYLWETLSEYAFSFKTWERLMEEAAYWIEFDIELPDLARMAHELGSVTEMNAALSHHFSS